MALAPFGYTLACRNRAAARFNRRGHGAAIGDFTEAIRLGPRDAEVYLRRGAAWESRRDYGKALADYAEAARLDPAMAIAQNNSAWIRATCPDAGLRDGKEAVASATRACEVTKWEAASCIDTLAAACAEAGDFDTAVKWQIKANAMFPEGKEKSDGEARLKLYRARTAYHVANP
jgi:tetratricopeptide (TPR) repeat protein